MRACSGERSLSLADLLCTAVHFIADRLANHIKRQLPRSHPVGELLLSGPGRCHRFLRRALQQRLPEVRLLSVDDSGIPSEYLPAAAAALLAQLHTDLIPANCSSLTGTRAPRILGRLTPGDPAIWHRLLAQMAESLPQKVPLRNAV
jgi:anhydro-N-acetylmuramic acid kinase